jgi:hypothetical protein
MEQSVTDTRFYCTLLSASNVIGVSSLSCSSVLPFIDHVAVDF